MSSPLFMGRGPLVENGSRLALAIMRRFHIDLNVETVFFFFFLLKFEADNSQTKNQTCVGVCVVLYVLLEDVNWLMAVTPSLPYSNE